MLETILGVLGCYESGKRLLEEARAWASSISSDRAADLLSHAQQGYRNQHLARFLSWLYPDAPLLTRSGHTYPVAAFPSSPEQSGDVDSILKRPVLLTQQDQSTLLPGSARYRALAAKHGLAQYNRPCFTMKSLQTVGTLQMDCELGGYLQALDTCDELDWELKSRHELLTGATPAHMQTFWDKLALRRRLHAAVANPVINGSRRHAAIAVSTLLAFRQDDDIQLLIRRRGPTSVAVHVGMVHVVPSFMFQPATCGLEDEFSVCHNFYREYLEELFNRPEPETQEGDAHYFYGDPRLQYLRSLMERGVATFHLSGVAVNLLNLRPEICTLMLINTPEWYERHRQAAMYEERFHYCDEWMPVTQMGETAARAVSKLKYVSDDATLLGQAGIQPWELVPPGAAALWLGKSVLDRVLPNLR